MKTSASTDQDKPELPDPDLVYIVDRTAHIENLLNQVITDYCTPRKDAWNFMWDVVLNTSVMSLSAKIKVVQAVAQEVDYDLKKDPLHKILSLRNAFAHHATNAHPVFVVRRTSDEDSSYLQLWLLDGSGKIKQIKRQDAFDKFNDAYKASYESLVTLKNLVRQKFVDKL